MAVDPLSATLSALADPTRRAILARLSTGEASVSELAEPFDMSLVAVSKHLKVLEKAGLISKGRRRNGVPAAWKPSRFAGWTIGWKPTGDSGANVSIGWKLMPQR